MATAMANLEWIKSISVGKAKFEKLEAEEQVGKFPLGILKHDENAPEYCESYEKVKEANRTNTMIQF